MIKELADIISKIQRFKADANNILSKHETSKSRVIILENTYDELKGLSLKQDELFRESLRCIENGLFRASHVLAWAGFIDFYEDKLSSDGFKKLKSVRKNWKFSTKEELRTKIPEYQLIDVSTDIKVCTKNEKNALLGLLNKRNECAHPSNYFPDLNETLGYISELFKRIKMLQKRTL